MKDFTMDLHPLSPVTYEFKNLHPNSKFQINRVEFFYADITAGLDDEQRKEIYNKVNSEKSKIDGNYNAFSIYVYRKTDKLNENYKGSYQEVKDGHDSDLISFTKWSNGKLETFYIIKDGNVVYDMVENREVKPPFEFE